MDKYLFPPMVVIISLAFGVGYTIGNINDNSNEEMSIILSVVAIGLAIAIFAFQNSQNEKIKEIAKNNEVILNEQIERTKRRHDYVTKLVQYKISYASDVAPSSKILKEIFLLPEEEQGGQIHDEISTIEYAIDELQNIQNLTSLYSDDLDPDEMKLILGVSKFAQILRLDLSEDVRILANDLASFEKKCDLFFQKFKRMDWSKKQEEVLD